MLTPYRAVIAHGHKLTLELTLQRRPTKSELQELRKELVPWDIGHLLVEALEKEPGRTSVGISWDMRKIPAATREVLLAQMRVFTGLASEEEMRAEKAGAALFKDVSFETQRQEHAHRRIQRHEGR